MTRLRDASFCAALIGLLPIVTLATFAPAAALAATADATLTGVVFDRAGAPIAGARVRVGGRETTTDTWGAWSIDLPAQAWEVEVEVDGQRRTTPTVPTVAGLSTELLITFDASSPTLRVLVEAPIVEGAPEAAEAPVGPTGALSGQIRSAEGGAPIANARVFVRGTTVEGRTDDQGRFLLDLPVGTWQISVVASGFAAQVVPEVGVALDTPASISVDLVPAGVALDDFTVRAPRIVGGTAALIEERKESSGVADVVGAEQMRKAGDPDAAQALRRVTGLTVVGGRYVYVRGLGDRYSATLLNGSSLPSPEPEKRVVPLDLFPTSVLDGVVILKTPSPDKPAEFGGGIVQIRTRSIPRERVLSANASVGYRWATSFRKALMGDSGPTDFLGVDGGGRAVPELVETSTQDQPIKPKGLFTPNGFDADQIEAFGESFTNRWDLSERMILPDLALQLTGGQAWETGGPRVGVLAALNWSNAWGYDDAFRNVYSSTDDGVVLRRSTAYQSVNNRVQLGGLFTLGASWGEDHEIASTTMLNRVSEAESLTFIADDPTSSQDSRGYRSSWAEQQLLFQQFTGHHLLSEPLAIQLDWRYAFSQATRLEPDRREHTYLRADNTWVLSQKGTWNELAWGDLVDTNHDVAVDLSIGVLKAAENPGQIKVGGWFVDRARNSATRRYSYEFDGIDGIDLTQPLGEITTPGNIGAEGEDDEGFLTVEEQTSNSDDYAATQRLGAAYAMADLPLHRRLRWMFGARMEHSAQQVSTFELFNPSQVPVGANLATTDVLPSTTVTIAVGGEDAPDEMLVRLSYGRTLSRPEFRELSEVPFTDFRTGVLFYGNPDLQRALIDNFDLRWEWYPRAGESLSVAAFGKLFRNPIEQVTEVSAVSGLSSTFANARRATNIGVEADFRFYFDHFHKSLSDLYMSGNAAFIYSRIDVGDSGNDTSEKRPLQGQSPWVVNAAIGYDSPTTGISVSLLYNVFGPRIVDVGQSGVPDTYELPVHRLDLVGLFPTGKGWQIRLRGSNLLDWPVRQRTGTEIAEEQRDGWGASIGIQYAAPPKADEDKERATPPASDGQR